MKTIKLTKKQITIIAMVSSILILSTAFFHYNAYLNSIYTAKIELAKQETAKAQAQAVKKSDIELLEFYAKENASLAKQRLEDITSHKAEIEKLQELYETELLTQRCYEAQIDRKIN